MELADLTRSQRDLLELEHQRSQGLCLTCGLQLRTGVMWWSHQQVDHPQAPATWKLLAWLDRPSPAAF
jgi:hypothetical protein